MSEKTTIIGSRKSDLALWQSMEVLALLSEQVAARGESPSFSVRTEVSQGDKILNLPLSSLASGNPGLFTKELEAGLLSGSYDMAVHSLKDMPTNLPPGLILAGICAREDPRDAVVMSIRHAATGFKRLEDLPIGSVIGTSSLRREAFLRRCYPHLVPTVVRGNLNTRLRKLDALPEPVSNGGGSGISHDELVAPAGKPVAYDALLLASAGLIRMGWGGRISSYPLLEDCPYGVGQGSLGIEVREGDEKAKSLARAVTHPPSALRCLAERAFLRALQGGCQIPIGVTTALSPPARVVKCSSSTPSSAGVETAEETSLQQQRVTLSLTGTVTSLDGSKTFTVSLSHVAILPKGSVLSRVNAPGLQRVQCAQRISIEGGLEELRLGGEAGSESGGQKNDAHEEWLGVSAEEWEEMVRAGEYLGRAGAEKILASSQGKAILESFGGLSVEGGRERPITYSQALQ